jgi:hypothetical protein
MRSSPLSSAPGDTSIAARRTVTMSGREPQAALPSTTSRAWIAMLGRTRIDKPPSMRNSARRSRP